MRAVYSNIKQEENVIQTSLREGNTIYFEVT